MSWYLDVLKQYAVFDGRARRQEYWMFVLINALVAGVTMGVDIAVGLNGILYALYCLAVIIPSFAVMVRRLHDIGKSGAWFFIAFIPIIGSILLLVYMVTDSTPGDNQFGPNPKGI
jgi:uncharacterized membrane protein YhaH (DUF805 family)